MKCYAEKAKLILDKVPSSRFDKYFDKIVLNIAKDFCRLDLLDDFGSDIEEWLIRFEDNSTLYYCEGFTKVIFKP